MLGTLLLRADRLDEAMAEFRQVIVYDPELPEAHRSIADILRRRDDEPGAASAMAEADRLIQRRADVQASLFALGTARSLLKKNDIAAAIEQLREAVRLDATNAEAHWELGRALDRTGDGSGARKHLAEARRLDPGLATPER
jgi:Flp pilus assembly protein TadD